MIGLTMTRRHGVAAVLLSIAVVAVSAVAAGSKNSTEGHPTVGGLQLTDVIAQLEAAEAAAHAKLTRGWAWILDTFSHFVIAGPLTFVFHELVYFGAWMPWLLLDQIPFFQKYKIQPDKKADSTTVLKCLRRLLTSHLCIQFPMQLGFHWAAQLMGFSLLLPLPPLRDLLWWGGAG